MGYQYDIFLSYPRQGAIGAWVRELLHPTLVAQYPDQCEPTYGGVFFDEELERGGVLPDRLAHALTGSAVMLAVWSPRYFSRDWCTAEWRSMLARERDLHLPTANGPALVYPLVYGDGDDFPEPARQTLQQRCFRRHAHLSKQAPGDVAMNTFRADVIELCQDLARWVHAAPAWQDGFPIEPPPNPSL